MSTKANSTPECFLGSSNSTTAHYMNETRFYHHHSNSGATKDNNVPSVHGKKGGKNNFMLPNGDGGSPIRIPVPPASRKKKTW